MRAQDDISRFATQTRANALDPAQLDPERAKRIVANRQVPMPRKPSPRALEPGAWRRPRPHSMRRFFQGWAAGSPAQSLRHEYAVAPSTRPARRARTAPGKRRSTTSTPCSTTSTPSPKPPWCATPPRQSPRRPSLATAASSRCAPGAHSQTLANPYRRHARRPRPRAWTSCSRRGRRSWIRPSTSACRRRSSAPRSVPPLSLLPPPSPPPTPWGDTPSCPRRRQPPRQHAT